MYIPESINKYINDKQYTTNSIGASDSRVLCFDDMVLKIEKESQESETHAKMLRWLEGKLPVSRVIAHENVDGTSYLLTTRAEGEMVCSQPLLSEPKEVTRLMAKALKMMWSVDITHCPVNYGLDNKLKLAEYYVENGLCDTDVEPETYGEGGFRDPADLLSWLKNNRPEEEFVLSHGDCCLPNIFAKDGEISGFIDLGRSGTADRYQDIALCWRSLKHNYDGRFGYKYEGYDPNLLFEYLGIEPDMEKIRYYILLDELF